MPTYILTGRITSLHAEPLKGLIVRAFNQPDQAPVILVGKDMLTDAAGQYNIVFNIQNNKTDGLRVARPNIFIRVFNGDILLGESKVNHNSKTRIKIDLPVGFSIDTPVETLRIVSGSIQDEYGKAIAGLIVHAFDRDLRSEQLLGSDKTDTRGAYSISYTTKHFQRAEKQFADLVVRVLNNDKKELAFSQVIFNASAGEAVNFVLKATEEQLSEWDQHVVTLTPLLDGIQFKDLNDDDISFLNSETAIDELHVAFISTAHKYAADNRISPEIFYALFRQELPTELSSLLVLSSRMLRTALEASGQQRIIRSFSNDQLDAVIHQLKVLAETFLVANETDRVSQSFRRLFGTAGISTEQQASFLTSYIQHKGTIEEFWKSLEKNPQFNGSIKPLQGILQLGLITQNNTFLVSALNELNISSPRDLSRLDETTLEQLITRSDEIVEAITAADPQEARAVKIKRYVETTMKVAREAFPTAFVKVGLERKGGANPSVLSVLEQAPDLELRDVSIDAYFEKNPAVLNSIADPEKTRTELKQIQRVLKIATRFEHLDALMQEGIQSAQDFSSMSQKACIELFKEKMGGEATVKSYYSRAQNICSSVNAAVTSIKQAVTDISPMVLGPSLSHHEVPTFTTLFGSYSLCACSHCRSVYSPAAYLVDILQFINPKSGTKPIASLRQRRPDIEHIQLTCENTNVPMPYIDLVNEILEFYIVHGQLTASAANDNGSATAEELSINPQNTIDQAYEILDAAVFPFSLPFNRSLSIARLYLEHLGVSLDKIMQAFQHHLIPANLDIACESLYISQAERDVLTGENPRPLREFYGYQSGNPNWIVGLAVVSEFLQRTQTNYDELLQLLLADFVNPGMVMLLSQSDDEPHCDLSQTKIEHLTEERLQRIHRFIRLARKLNWSFEELDHALIALKAADITPEVLQKLAALKRVQVLLDLKRDVIFSFWSSIGTKGNNALYHRLFLNKRILSSTDPDFQLNEDGSELLSAELATPKTLVAKAPAISAALRLSTADLPVIYFAKNLNNGEVPLNLSNLSILHRYAALARALKISVRDMMALSSMSGIDPLVEGGPAKTLLFSELVEKIKNSGFSISHLNYICCAVDDEVKPHQPLETVIEVFRDNLQTELLTIAHEQALVEDPTGDLLRTKLAMIVPSEFLAQPDRFVGEAMRIIETQFGENEPSIADQNTFIEQHFASFLDVNQAILFLNQPIPPPNDQIPSITIADKRKYVFTRLVDHLRVTLCVQHIVESLTENFNVEGQMGQLLFREILNSSADPSQRVWIDFIALQTNEELAEALMQNFRRSYLRINKVVSLLNGFRVTVKELSYLNTHSTNFDGFDLNNIPAEPVTGIAPFFNVWKRLAQLFAWRATLPQIGADWVDVFAAASREESIALLKEASLWSSEEVDFLVGADGFNLDGPAFGNEIKMLSLQEALSISQRIGVSTQQLFKWAQTLPTAAIANEIIHSAKTKYDPEQWLMVAKPINDTLRERQKAALISFILATGTMLQRKITNANQLFEYFLIDVEMSACMDTSRIKQAISSVQLFVQRCLMNLEGNNLAIAIDEDAWEWMKNYRVWEANRKVFLYPENWIEPELRDDKSPIYKKCESLLLQNELTVETAEQCCLTYLEGLDAIAHLEICGIYHQEGTEDDEAIDILHVFGRTKDEPRVYYYRHLSGGIWSSWENISVDIEGDHLIPTIYNRRLYLFWLHFEEKPDEFKNLEDPFIQSEEHWKWAKDYHEWVKAHDKWTGEHGEWITKKNFVENFEANLRAVEAQLQIAQGAFQSLAQPFREEFDELIEPMEPREPSEPPYSTPPPLTNWEIKLAWSEYHYGKWSTKKTSENWVESPYITRNLEEFVKLYITNETIIEGFLRDPNDLEAQILRPETKFGERNTVCKVYLPEKQHHFVQTGINDVGELFLIIWRRFTHTYKVLDRGEDSFSRYQSLGFFTLACGSKVKSVSQIWNLGTSDNNLIVPKGCTNVFQGLEKTEGLNKLEFIQDPSDGIVLNNIPERAGNLTLVCEGLSSFQMKVPYEPFFYRDLDKTYYVHYQRTVTLESIRNPDKAVLGVNLKTHTSQVENFQLKKELLAKSRSTRSFERTINAVATNPSINGSPPEELFLRNGQGKTTMWRNGTGITKVNLARVDDWIVQQGSAFSQLVINAKEGLRFETFFHPHVCGFTKALYSQGVAGLLSLSSQRLANDRILNKFSVLYQPSDLVHEDYPREDVDFGNEAYASYNWELFFHIPLMIAMSYSRNQKFDEAQRWFHYIFNPTSTSPEPHPQRYWNVKPFFNNTTPGKEQIQELLSVLDSTKPADQTMKNRVLKQIREWRENPFNPHLLARLRITAYQKNVVMKYIDNLISWGDQLFSRDTIESMNEATQYYVIAYQILGPKPSFVTSPMKVQAKSYAELSNLNEFSNALVSYENEFPYEPADDSSNTIAFSSKRGEFSRWPIRGRGTGTLRTAPGTPYFCTPKNEQLLAYWDLVEDRLFKIRNCMNLDGVVRKLPLFEPPIDPALLVRATAAGLDIGSVLSDLSAPPPHYRFTTMLQKALELCNELKSLSATLLGILEKKDAEALSTLRTSQETALLKLVREVKQLQIDEAKATLFGLQKTRAITETRYNFYRDIENINVNEQAHMDSLGTAQRFNKEAQDIQVDVARLNMLPNFDVGTEGMSSPVVKASFGGTNLASALQAESLSASLKSSEYTYNANMASIKGGYVRRWNDWKLQQDLADKELNQIDQQIAGQYIRINMAETDIKNHDVQIANNLAVEEFFRNKYTNEQLYNWMMGQVSKVYFQSYKLAFDMAKRAEKTFRYELGITSNFIQFGYWDSLKKGLLAGEQLCLDLKRMETAYFEKNKRSYEITKHISLLQLDPLAILSLKSTGNCNVTIPEWLYDLDCPGHFKRRIKTVGLSIPCVAGPYTSINCTLSLHKSTIRISALGNDYKRASQNEDSRFQDNYGTIQSIVTSSAQNDSGLFEVNLHDERYLPFEGGGVESTWSLSLPNLPRQFNYDTISDVILHIRYTASEGGDHLRKKAQTFIADKIAETGESGLARLLSLRHEFPGSFHQLLNPIGGTQVSVFKLEIEHFPYFLSFANLELSEMTVYLKAKRGEEILTQNVSFSIKGNDITTWIGGLGNLKAAIVTVTGTPLGDWAIEATGLNKSVLEDILILIKYNTN